jgi:hypothetical protein
VVDFIEDNTPADWSSIIEALWNAQRGVVVVRQDAQKMDRRRRAGKSSIIKKLGVVKPRVQ